MERKELSPMFFPESEYAELEREFFAASREDPGIPWREKALELLPDLREVIYGRNAGESDGSHVQLYFELLWAYERILPNE